MNMKDYFVNCGAHLDSPWVSVILALICLSLAIQSLVKDRNVRFCLVCLFLMLCCIGFEWGDIIIAKLASLW